MINRISHAVLIAAVVSGTTLIGCDRTVSEHTTSKTDSDGKTTVDTSKTTQNPDGSTQTKTEHSTDTK